MAPRVLIANANLVPRLGQLGRVPPARRPGPHDVRADDRRLAGSTSARRASCRAPTRPSPPPAQKHFGGDLAGRLVLTAGLGGMGGAQPLAVTMAGGVALCVEVDPQRIARRLETGYLDVAADIAGRGAASWPTRPSRRSKPLSIGLLGNAADVYPELVRRGVTPDLVTDQTSAHDTLNGYVPNGMTLERGARAAPRATPTSTCAAPSPASSSTSRRWSPCSSAGAHVFDYGNNIRGVAKEAGYADAFAFPGFVPAYIRPLFCRGNGPFRWAALSGDPADIARHRRAPCSRPSRTTRWSRAGSRMAAEKVHFQGLPCRICWLEYGERAKAGQIFNELVRTRQGQGAASSSAATTSTPARSRARTARPRACATAATPSPTGRSSTPCSTPPPAPAG